MEVDKEKKLWQIQQTNSTCNTFSQCSICLGAPKYQGILSPFPQFTTTPYHICSQYITRITHPTDRFLNSFEPIIIFPCLTPNYTTKPIPLKMQHKHNKDFLLHPNYNP
jgi:hypothetical protein